MPQLLKRKSSKSVVQPEAPQEPPAPAEHVPMLQDLVDFISAMIQNCQPLSDFVAPGEFSIPAGLEQVLVGNRAEGVRQILERIEKNVERFKGNYFVVFCLVFVYFAYSDPVLKWHLMVGIAVAVAILSYSQAHLEIYHPFVKEPKLLAKVHKTRVLISLMTLFTFSVYNLCFNSFVRSAGFSSGVLLLHSFFSSPPKTEIKKDS